MPGLPNHILVLMKCAPIMILRNIDVKGGPCNGMRLHVVQLVDHVIQARIITATNVGSIFLCLAHVHNAIK